MARVRVLPAIVYTSYGHAPGDEVDLRDDIAATWVAAGLAARVDELEIPERGQGAEKPEDAARPETPEGGRALETPEKPKPAGRRARSRKQS